MKKTSVYILSVIVIAVLACSVLAPAFRLISTAAEGFIAGFNAGMESAESGITAPKIDTSIEVNFKPQISTMIAPPDTLALSGEAKPIVLEKAAVMVSDSKIPGWYPWVTGFCYPLEIILLIILIWKFLKFTINISKGRIFEKCNVRLLRQFSYMLLAIALLEICSGIANDIIFSGFGFNLEGYRLSAYWDFPWSDILLGSTGLLMAQVWSIGMDLKQDQELTI